MKEKPAHFDNNPVSTIPWKFYSRLYIPWCNSNLLFMSGHLGKWCADKMVREWWFYTDFPLNFDSWLCKINSSNVCKFLYDIFYFSNLKFPQNITRITVSSLSDFVFTTTSILKSLAWKRSNPTQKLCFQYVFACVNEISFFCFFSLVTFEEFQKTS